MENFHLALYRKYRPQKFNDVIGQSHIVEILKNAVRLNKISHAFLFSGERGIGKTSIARILAKAANCENRKENEFEPCNSCVSCNEITHGNSLDLVEIDAASNRGIDEIRALKEAVRLNPLKSKYRVYIIDEVHMLTKEAFNALLKTLEEPPRFAIFILATTETEKIPETIISRCQHFKFKKTPENLIKVSLSKILEKEGVKADLGTLEIISILADGSLRDAHSKLEQALDSDKKRLEDSRVRDFFGIPPENLISDFLTNLISKNTEENMKIASQIAENNFDQRLFIKLIIKNLRFLLILMLAPGMERDLKSHIPEEKISFLKNLKSGTKSENIESALKIFLNAYSSPFYSYFPELPLEIAIAETAKLT